MAPLRETLLLYRNAFFLPFHQLTSPHPSLLSLARQPIHQVTLHSTLLMSPAMRQTQSTNTRSMSDTPYTAMDSVSLDHPHSPLKVPFLKPASLVP